MRLFLIAMSSIQPAPYITLIILAKHIIIEMKPL